MQLDEWSEDQLAIAHTIGGGLATPMPRPLAPPGGDLDALLRRMPPAGSEGTRDAPQARAAFDDDHLFDNLDDIGGLDRRLGVRDWVDEVDGAPRPGDGAFHTLDGTKVEADATPDGSPQRLDTNMALGLCQAMLGGDGVIVALQIGGQPAQAWVDERAWCDWLSTRMTVPGIAQVPATLLAVLGQWAMVPLVAHASRAGVAPPEFVSAEAGFRAPALATTLVLRNGEKELQFRLLDWPADWVRTLAGGMEVQSAPAEMPPVVARLAAGWTRISRARLDALKPGDGVVLEHATSIEHGHAWLVADTPVAELAFDHGTWRVERSCRDENDMNDTNAMNDMNDMNEFEAPVASDSRLADDQIHLTAVAEVGRMSMPLDVLRNLHTGKILELPHGSDGRVSLTVNGHVVASGSLLRVGDRLVLRIA